MLKPYIFGHRGAMGYEIENTIPAFKIAIKMGAGIESDIRLTKDKRLVCFHDPSFQIDGKWYSIKNLTYKELRNLNFQDGRCVPLLEDVFKEFSKDREVRYSFDIGNRNVVQKIIPLAKSYNILDKIEITDISLKTLYYISQYDKNIKLIHTIPYHISDINEKTVNYDKLKDHNINVLNIKSNRATKENFKNIIDHEFECYVWNLIGKGRMKKTLRLRYKDEGVKAMYTNYPDVLIKIRNKFFN